MYTMKSEDQKPLLDNEDGRQAKGASFGLGASTKCQETLITFSDSFCQHAWSDCWYVADNILHIWSKEAWFGRIPDWNCFWMLWFRASHFWTTMCECGKFCCLNICCVSGTTESWDRQEWKMKYYVPDSGDSASWHRGTRHILPSIYARAPSCTP